MGKKRDSATALADRLHRAAQRTADGDSTVSRLCRLHGPWVLAQFSSPELSEALIELLKSFSKERLFKGADRKRSRTKLDSAAGEQRAWQLIDLHRREIPIREMRALVRQPWEEKPPRREDGSFDFQNHPAYAASPTGLQVQRYTVMRPIIHFLNGDEPTSAEPEGLYNLFWDPTAFYRAIGDRLADRGEPEAIAGLGVEADRRFEEQYLGTLFEKPTPEVFLEGIDTPSAYAKQRGELLRFLDELRAGRACESPHICPEYKVSADGTDIHDASVALSLLRLCYSHLAQIRHELPAPDNDWLRQCRYRRCDRLLFPWEAHSAFCCDEHRYAESRAREKDAEVGGLKQAREKDRS